MTFDGVRRVFADLNLPTRRFTSIMGLMAASVVGLACAIAAETDNAEIAHRRSIERRSFTDAEIIDGFFKVTFGAEFHVAGGVDRIRKYEGPIRVFIDNRATPNRTQQVEAAVADVRSRIRNLDFAVIDQRDDANMIVSLVND